MTSRRPAQRGFTLIELMVALVVSGVVVLGVFAFSNIQRSNASAHERNVMIQQALEGAMASLGQDVSQAGVGFTRTCTELRVWDAASGRLINPGVGDPNDAVVDAVTQERYWVLRDGVQAHWRSDDAASIDVAVDSLDVIVGEPAYLGYAGVFNITAPIDTASTALTATTSSLLDPNNPLHVAQVQQLFPPGSFVMLAPRPPSATLSFSPIAQGQCVLLQVTDDVTAGAGANEWSIPIASTSPFNDLTGLLGDYGNDPACVGETPACNDDWTADTMAAVSVVPLGRLRWSRYAIDYSISTLPYLVRFDIIGHQPGVDPGDLGAGADYPHCQAGSCPAAGLHLPGSDSPPAAVAIGPMIEDMQVAVGCDGWSDASADELGLRRPDVGFEDLGTLLGAQAGLPNAAVDEHTAASTERNADEWLGNAIAETRAADCVQYGTGEYNRDAWAALESDPGPAFRMSPRTVRVTLVGSAEADEFAGGLASDQLLAVEDRAAMTSSVGSRQRFTLTERFSPENARWQDPRLR
jgi:prepilin-type N-terminal cleavage/methylation domain-containing protein